MRGRGFSTVETIFSAFIVCTVMMAMFNLFPTASIAIRRADLKTTANALAGQCLEEYRAMAFEDVQLGPSLKRFRESRGVQFTLSPEVVKEPGTDPDLLKIVRVGVSWKDGKRDFSVTHEAWLVHVDK